MFYLMPGLHNDPGDVGLVFDGGSFGTDSISFIGRTLARL